jgi:predicted RNase H-like HicB family nuclease
LSCDPAGGYPDESHLALPNVGPRSLFSEEAMRRQFTLEYWTDGDWVVGRLLEVPGVFSQGTTLEELRENIQEAYELMVTRERDPAPATAQQQPVDLDV